MNRVGSNMFGEVIKLKMTMDIIWVIMYIELGETDQSKKFGNKMYRNYDKTRDLCMVTI